MKKELIVCAVSLVAGVAAALVWEQLNPYGLLIEEVLAECGEQSFSQAPLLANADCFAEFHRERGVYPMQLHRLQMEYEEQVIYPSVIAAVAFAVGLLSRKRAVFLALACIGPLMFLPLRESAWLWGRRLGYCFLYPMVAAAAALSGLLLRRLILRLVALGREPRESRSKLT